MATYSVKTKDRIVDPRDKARVFFTCHPDDFAHCFDKICEDIFKTHNCAVYYTEDMTEHISQEEREVDLGQMGMFVIPVSYRLLSTPNRAFREDLTFAKERHIPILPILIEEYSANLYELYSQPESFGDLQYLEFRKKDVTARSYEEKLENILSSALTDEQTLKRVKSAFDAYVFLSYRKKDRRYALELMKKIHKYQECWTLAVWYDEFLIPGENFKESISTILNNSKIFALLVTPNLLEEANYVMQVEYPAAKQAGLDLLPVEMVKTDRKSLDDKYEKLPECVNIDNEEAFKDYLFKALEKVDFIKNDTPDRNYLIGLAYLDGIYVEVDAERATGIITAAAEQDIPEAMEKLYDMYYLGKGVPRDYHKAMMWAEKLIEYSKKTWGNNHVKTRRAVDSYISAYSGIYYKKYHRLIALDKKEKQLEYDEKIIEIKRRFLGDNDPNLIRDLLCLATLYLDLEDRQKSIELRKEIYAIESRSLGEEHPDTIDTLKTIALLYFTSSQYQESIETHEKLYRIAHKVGGEEHQAAISALIFLPTSYKMLGNYQKALEWAEKKYSVWCNLLAKGDVEKKDIDEIKTFIKELKKKIRQKMFFAKIFGRFKSQKADAKTSSPIKEFVQNIKNNIAAKTIFTYSGLAVLSIIYVLRLLFSDMLSEHWWIYVTALIVWIAVSVISLKKRKWIKRFIWIFAAIMITIFGYSIYLLIK